MNNIYDFNEVKNEMKITRKDLRPNDILEYKNGEKCMLYEQYYWALLEFYDDDLNHVYNDDYSIAKVYRPEYEVIFERAKGKVK